MAQHRDSLILIFLVGIICFRQPVNGNKDREMIDRVCGEWTIFPETCHKCLDDVSGAGDEKGLGIASIQCAYAQSFTVIHDFDAIANASGDPAVKLLCGRCKEIIGGAVGSIDEARKECDYGFFDGAADRMTDAGNRYEECSKLVQKIPAPPADFSDHFSLLKQDYQVAEAIMEKLNNT